MMVTQKSKKSNSSLYVTAPSSLLKIRDCELLERLILYSALLRMVDSDVLNTQKSKRQAGEAASRARWKVNAGEEKFALAAEQLGLTLDFAFSVEAARNELRPYNESGNQLFWINLKVLKDYLSQDDLRLVDVKVVLAIRAIIGSRESKAARISKNKISLVAAGHRLSDHSKLSELETSLRPSGIRNILNKLKKRGLIRFFTPPNSSRTYFTSELQQQSLEEYAAIEEVRFEGCCKEKDAATKTQEFQALMDSARKGLVNNTGKPHDSKRRPTDPEQDIEYQSTPTRFNEFKSLYPKPEGTAKAKAEFDKLAECDIDKLFAATKNYIEAVQVNQANGGLLKTMANFMNDEYWRDWISPSPEMMNPPSNSTMADQLINHLQTDDHENTFEAVVVEGIKPSASLLTTGQRQANDRATTGPTTADGQEARQVPRQEARQQLKMKSKDEELREFVEMKTKYGF